MTQDVRFWPRPPHGGMVVMQRRLSVGDYILYLEVLAEQFEHDSLADQVHYCEW